MEKTLKDYVLNTKKEYHYILKFSFEITPQILEKIERILEKYDTIEISKPKKAIIQSNPIGFENMGALEIYSLDITTNYPAYNELLKSELAMNLRKNENTVVVLNKNDPYNNELERLSDKKDQLINSEDNSTSFYGDKYNKDMLDTISKNAKKLDIHNLDIPKDNFLDGLNNVRNSLFSNVDNGAKLKSEVNGDK